MIAGILTFAAIKAVLGYRYFISPFLPKHCRFFPSCSVFALQVLRELPLYRAVPRILWRLCRCHPFHPGGVDLP